MNAYDFDGTLYDGDCTRDFIFFCLRKRPALSLRMLGALWPMIRYYAFRRGGKTAFKERLYAFLPRLPDPCAEAEAFWDEAIGRIKPFYFSLRRPDDLVISASPEFLLRPAMRRLGIGQLIASSVDPASGLYRGENCHGEEKVLRFQRACPGEEIEAFYSDSRSDRPLARRARRAYRVRGQRIEDWPWH